MEGHNLRQSAVRVIFMLIEGGDIHPGDFGDLQQKCLLTPPFCLGPVVKGHNLHRALLPFSQREKVDEVRQGLRVEGTHAAGKHHLVQALPVPGVQGDTGKIQHIENIGIAHLIANGKGNHIKVLYRLAALQRPQGNVMLAHGLLHVPPGGKHPLAPHAVHFVHHAIQNPHTHIGHTNLVGIRKAEGHIHPNLGRVLLNFVVFSAGITGRFLHRRQDSLQ